MSIITPKKSANKRIMSNVMASKVSTKVNIDIAYSENHERNWAMSALQEQFGPRINKQREIQEAKQRILDEQQAKLDAFYNSEDCIDMEMYVTLIETILYAANYYMTELEDLFVKHGLRKKKFATMLNNCIQAYPPVYKFLCNSKIMAHKTMEDSDELHNEMIALCDEIIAPVKADRLKLQEGEKLRYEKQCGCDTCRKFLTQNCSYSLNKGDFDREWMAKFYTCMGYQKKIETK